MSAANSINATIVSALGCELHQIYGFNAAAAKRYLRFFDIPTTPAPAADFAKVKWAITLQASVPFSFWFPPLIFASGCGYVITTVNADNDVTAVTAADIENLNVLFV